jgi:hypothetical protein
VMEMVMVLKGLSNWTERRELLQVRRCKVDILLHRPARDGWERLEGACKDDVETRRRKRGRIVEKKEDSRGTVQSPVSSTTSQSTSSSVSRPVAQLKERAPPATSCFVLRRTPTSSSFANDLPFLSLSFPPPLLFLFLLRCVSSTSAPSFFPFATTDSFLLNPPFPRLPLVPSRLYRQSCPTRKKKRTLATLTAAFRVVRFRCAPSTTSSPPSVLQLKHHSGGSRGISGMAEVALR